MHLRLKLRCADSKSFLACRTAEMSWEELWGDVKGWSVLITPQCKQLRRIYLHDMWEEMGWDEKSWDEARWGAKSQDEMRWDEVWSKKCEVRGVKSAVWSAKKVLAWSCIAPESCAGHVLGRQQCNSFAQSTHARAWLVHGECKFYRWKKPCSTTLCRQLPPRLVRVLLVYIKNLHPENKPLARIPNVRLGGKGRGAMWCNVPYCYVLLL